MPVRPGLLAADGFRASPAEAFATDGDGVGISLLVRKNVIELAVGCADDDRRRQGSRAGRKSSRALGAVSRDAPRRQRPRVRTAVSLKVATMVEARAPSASLAGPRTPGQPKRAIGRGMAWSTIPRARRSETRAGAFFSVPQKRQASNAQLVRRLPPAAEL